MVVSAETQPGADRVPIGGSEALPPAIWTHTRTCRARPAPCVFAEHLIRIAGSRRRPCQARIGTRPKPARTTCDRLRARRYQTAPSPARATQSPSDPVAPPARAPAYATGRARRQRARSRSGTSSGCSTLQSAQCCSRCERKRRHARRDAKAARSRPHGAGRASRQQRDSSRRRPVRCRDRLPRRPPCLRLRVRAYSLPRPDPRVPHSEIGGLPGEIARDALVATRRALGGRGRAPARTRRRDRCGRTEASRRCVPSVGLSGDDKRGVRALRPRVRLGQPERRTPAACGRPDPR